MDRILAMDKTLSPSRSAPVLGKSSFSTTWSDDGTSWHGGSSPGRKRKNKNDQIGQPIVGRGQHIDQLMGVNQIQHMTLRGLDYDPLESVLLRMRDVNSKSGPIEAVSQRRVNRWLGEPAPAIDVLPKLKASVEGDQHLLSESLSPGSRRRRRGMPAHRRLALGEFQTWMKQMFKDSDELWAVLCEENMDKVGKDKFAQTLADHLYPMGSLGARMLFFFLDSDDDEAVALQDIKSGLEELEVAENPSPKNWERFSNSLTEWRQTKNQDVIEDHNVRCQIERLNRMKLGVENTSKQEGLAALMLRTSKGEPAVADFIEYILDGFNSIQMAWTIMDVKKAGTLSRDEFTDSMSYLVSNQGVRPFPAHLTKLGKLLFPSLDPSARGFIKMEVLRNLEGSSPCHGPGRYLLQRLGRFIRKHATVRLPVARSEIDHRSFFMYLEQAGYPRWHVDNLFDCIDRDGSGDIRMDDILTFLSPEEPGMNLSVPKVLIGFQEVLPSRFSE